MPTYLANSDLVIPVGDSGNVIRTVGGRFYAVDQLDAAPFVAKGQLTIQPEVDDEVATRKYKAQEQVRIPKGSQLAVVGAVYDLDEAVAEPFVNKGQLMLQDEQELGVPDPAEVNPDGSKLKLSKPVKK